MWFLYLGPPVNKIEPTVEVGSNYDVYVTFFEINIQANDEMVIYAFNDMNQPYIKDGIIINTMTEHFQNVPEERKILATDLSKINGVIRETFPASSALAVGHYFFNFEVSERL